MPGICSLCREVLLAAEEADGDDADGDDAEGHMCCRWLWANSSAQYDTLAIASEDQTQQVQQACQHCIYVFTHSQGPAAGRYAALYQLIHTTRWQVEVAGKYEYIYFPEDEIVQAVDSVNRYGARCCLATHAILHLLARRIFRTCCNAAGLPLACVSPVRTHALMFCVANGELGAADVHIV